MKLKPYSDVVLKRNLPKYGLKRGDVVKLLDRHIAPNRKIGYSIEVFNALGKTIAVTTVPASAVEPLRKNEILCARVMSH